MLQITVDRGVRLTVQDLNPGGKRTIVFVHGWPLGKEIFECQYDVLPEYGIRCVSYDMRGFGDSDKPWCNYNYDRMADDLCRVLQAMDLRNITLCGFSMGGAVCCRYMSRYRGGRVRNLVLMAAAAPSFVQRPGFPYGMTKDEVDNLITDLYNDRPGAVSDFARRCFVGEPSAPYMDWMQDISCEAAGWATIRCAEALRDEDLRPDLSRIRVPTCILHGVQDQICPFPLAQEMDNTIPNSFVVPFEHSGHCLYYQEHNKCNSSLIDFINS